MYVVPDASWRPPVVIAVAPRRGWAAADRPVWLAVGPACFYSLARVLRP